MQSDYDAFVERGDFTIYHVPSLRKVGCTRNFEKSYHERYSGRAVFVLQTIPSFMGPKFAGDIEWNFADLFGYKKRSHYTNTWDFKLTKEQRRKFGALGAGGHTPEGRARVIAAGRLKVPKGFATMDADLARSISREAGKIAARSPNHPNSRRVTCPHCSLTTTLPGAKRWHFDNCRMFAK